MRNLFCGILLVAATSCYGQTMQQFFKALGTVESSNNDNAVGDNGKSIGRYQIQYDYWKDSGVKGQYQQVKNHEYAERVMIAYWTRYCPKALKGKDFQTLSRIHNGGPRGHKIKATLKYWAKVKAALK